MPYPLLVNQSVLAQSVVHNAPRFAAMLMAAKDDPIMVESRLSKADLNALSPVNRISPVAKWASAVALASAMSVPAHADDKVDAYSRSIASKHQLAPIASIYTKYLRANQPVNRMRTADQVRESQRPSKAGESSPAAKNTPASQRSEEGIVLTAAIVGVGFEDLVDRQKTKGSFDLVVLKQVDSAMKVIAPNKSPSEMTEVERKAIATLAMYASNGQFLNHMQIQNPGMFELRTGMTTRIRELSKSIPSAGDLAKEFIVNGEFSEVRFKERVIAAIAGGALAPEQASQDDLKRMAFATAAQKAGDVVEAAEVIMEERFGSESSSAKTWMKRMALSVHASKISHQDRLEMSDQPTEQSTMRTM